MTSIEVKKEAQTLKLEAVSLLKGLFNTPAGCENPAIDRLVDCIICAAILEIAVLHKEAMTSVSEKK